MIRTSSPCPHAMILKNWGVYTRYTPLVPWFQPQQNPEIPTIFSFINGQGPLQEFFLFLDVAKAVICIAQVGKGCCYIAMIRAKLTLLHHPIGEVVAEEDFRKHAQKITVWINLRINPILHSQENWWVGSWQYEMYVRDQLQDFCEMSSEISNFCSNVCFKFPTVALKTQQLRNNQETRINDISAISTQWKHLQGMGHASVLNFQSLLQMESLLCSISTKTIPRVTRWWSAGLVKTTEDWRD